MNVWMMGFHIDGWMMGIYMNGCMIRFHLNGLMMGIHMNGCMMGIHMNCVLYMVNLYMFILFKTLSDNIFQLTCFLDNFGTNCPWFLKYLTGFDPLPTLLCNKCCFRDIMNDNVVKLLPPPSAV